jgi:hypothetical protein
MSIHLPARAALGKRVVGAFDGVRPMAVLGPNDRERLSTFAVLASFATG